MAQKKTTASSASVGKLHAKLVKIFGLSLDQVIEKLEAGEDAMFVAEPKLLNAVAKFLNDNKCWTVEDEEVADNPLAKQLAEIRARQSVTPMVVKEG